MVDVLTAEEGCLSLAWIEGFALFTAVFVCCNVTAINVKIKTIVRIIKGKSNLKISIRE